MILKFGTFFSLDLHGCLENLWILFKMDYGFQFLPLHGKLFFGDYIRFFFFNLNIAVYANRFSAKKLMCLDYGGFQFFFYRRMYVISI